MSVQNLSIDGAQHCELGEAWALADVMHGLPHEAEFEYGAIILDEARVRRAAAGRKLRLLAGHILDRCGHQLDEGARLGHERVGIRRFPLDVPADAPG